MNWNDAEPKNCGSIRPCGCACESDNGYCEPERIVSWNILDNKLEN